MRVIYAMSTMSRPLIRRLSPRAPPSKRSKRLEDDAFVSLTLRLSPHKVVPLRRFGGLDYWRDFVKRALLLVHKSIEFDKNTLTMSTDDPATVTVPWNKSINSITCIN